MAQNVYIIYNNQSKYIVDQICRDTFVNRRFFSEDLSVTEGILTEICNQPGSEYFYIINPDTALLFPHFDFSFRPPVWDADYVHMWNNDTSVMLYKRSNVLSNPVAYTSDSLKSGAVHLKNIEQRICSKPALDIVFLSYDEPYALDHYESLKSRFPRAKHIAGVKGIYEAHKFAAKSVTTDMFYVVDADALVMPDFDFSHQPLAAERLSVHVWKSMNPVNDLVYGYGGVKLFPTALLNEYVGSPVDFTTSVSKSFKVMDAVSNITKFNTDPFSTWRSAFRECAKLSSRLISNQDDTETSHRLDIWCSLGADREFGEFALLGANEGRRFGMENVDYPDKLRVINDYSWLEERFSS